MLFVPLIIKRTFMGAALGLWFVVLVFSYIGGPLLISIYIYIIVMMVIFSNVWRYICFGVLNKLWFPTSAGFFEGRQNVNLRFFVYSSYIYIYIYIYIN